MKNLVTLLAVFFLLGTSTFTTTNASNNFVRGYGNSFNFVEGGIEFSVFPDGQFDFYMPNQGPNVNVAINTPGVAVSFNSGFNYNPFVQFDDFGAIIQIEILPDDTHADIAIADLISDGNFRPSPKYFKVIFPPKLIPLIKMF